MNYGQLLRNRRSIRQFEDRPVEMETITAMLNDGILAPSSGNRQEWRFVIVNNKEWMKKISDESKKNKVKEIEENPASYYKRYEDILRNEQFNAFFNAPCLILVLGPKDNLTLKIDCSLIVSYLMFAAANRGLGTCWIGLGDNIKDPELLKALGITDDLEVVAPIIVGYPKSIPAIPARKAPQVLKVIQ